AQAATLAKLVSLGRVANSRSREAALTLARSAVERSKSGRNRAEYLMTLGVAEYRIGHLAEAGRVLASASGGAHQDLRITGTSAYFQAMSLFRQGKPDEGRQIAVAAAATMKPLPKDEKNPLANGADVEDLIWWLAYKEARALIGFDVVPAATTG